MSGVQTGVHSTTNKYLLSAYYVPGLPQVFGNIDQNAYLKKPVIQGLLYLKFSSYSLCKDSFFFFWRECIEYYIYGIYNTQYIVMSIIYYTSFSAKRFLLQNFLKSGNLSITYQIVLL